MPVEPSDEHIRVGYAVTGVLDVDSDSGDPGDHHDDSKGSGNLDDSRKLSGFSPETGDNAPIIPLAVAAVAALVAAIAARRRSR